MFLCEANYVNTFLKQTICNIKIKKKKKRIAVIIRMHCDAFIMVL